MTNSSTLDDVSVLVKTLKDEAETGVKDSDSALSRAKDFAIMSNAHAAAARLTFAAISEIAYDASADAVFDAISVAASAAAEPHSAHLAFGNNPTAESTIAYAHAIAEISAAAAERSAKADAAAESARGAVVFWDKTMKASVAAARLAVDNYASYLSNAPKEVVALS